MSELIMLEETVESTEPKKVNVKETDTYEYKTIEQEPMEMDTTPWLSKPPLSMEISSFDKPDLFLLMWS